MPVRSAGITFRHTGSEQLWMVPAGVTSIRATMFGGHGSMDSATNAKLEATLSVTPGEQLFIYVGGWAEIVAESSLTFKEGGWPFGGGAYGDASPGGGLSAIVSGSGIYTGTVLAVAGGTGGRASGPTFRSGGDNEGLTGGDGRTTIGSSVLGGGGGTQTTAGVGGTGGSGTGYVAPEPGDTIDRFYGGLGGYTPGNLRAGGGGGAGWYGGGGGAAVEDGLSAGGGGGSSYTDPVRATDVVYTPGYGNIYGRVELSWGEPQPTTLTATNELQTYISYDTSTYGVPFTIDAQRISNDTFRVNVNVHDVDISLTPIPGIGVSSGLSIDIDLMSMSNNIHSESPENAWWDEWGAACFEYAPFDVINIESPSAAPTMTYSSYRFSTPSGEDIPADTIYTFDIKATFTDQCEIFLLNVSGGLTTADAQYWYTPDYAYYTLVTLETCRPRVSNSSGFRAPIETDIFYQHPNQIPTGDFNAIYQEPYPGWVESSNPLLPSWGRLIVAPINLPSNASNAEFRFSIYAQAVADGIPGGATGGSIAIFDATDYALVDSAILDSAIDAEFPRFFEVSGTLIPGHTYYAVIEILCNYHTWSIWNYTGLFTYCLNLDASSCATVTPDVIWSPPEGIPSPNIYVPSNDSYLNMHNDPWVENPVFSETYETVVRAVEGTIMFPEGATSAGVSVEFTATVTGKPGNVSSDLLLDPLEYPDFPNLVYLGTDTSLYDYCYLNGASIVDELILPEDGTYVTTVSTGMLTDPAVLVSGVKLFIGMVTKFSTNQYSWELTANVTVKSCGGTPMVQAPALTWLEPGSRVYETGVDRGVIYFNNGRVVPWNGLTSVDEKFNRSAEAVYFDGVKIHEMTVIEGFSADVAAITYPDQFEEVYGNLELRNGVYLGEQSAQTFGFCYRNKLGTDLNADAGYKIHIVYNVLATPQDRTYNTISDEPDLTEFEWEFTTTPEYVVGHRPSAHLIIDTTQTSPELVATIEELLYGTETTPPALPSLTSLLTMIAEFNNFISITDNGDGTWTAETAAPGVINDLGSGVIEIQHATTQPTSDESYLISPTPDAP